MDNAFPGGTERGFGPKDLISRREYRLILIGFLVLIPLILGGYLYWKRNLSSEAKEAKWRAEQIEQFYKANAEFEAAMRADTWGGKTPRETLDLFIAALQKGDVELAARYFMLETDDKSPDYLTRKKWEDGLRNAQAEGRVPQIITNLKSMVESRRSAGEDNSFEYVLYGPSDVIDYALNLKLNRYSSVWKIESL